MEPDLSKVMILDNSPMSYIFHEGKLTTLTLFASTNRHQTTPFPSKAGLATLQTTSCSTSFLSLRGCSM